MTERADASGCIPSPGEGKGLGLGSRPLLRTRRGGSGWDPQAKGLDLKEEDLLEPPNQRFGKIDIWGKTKFLLNC